jgi:hypothetical protein
MDHCHFSYISKLIRETLNFNIENQLNKFFKKVLQKKGIDQVLVLHHGYNKFEFSLWFCSVYNGIRLQKKWKIWRRWVYWCWIRKLFQLYNVFNDHVSLKFFMSHAHISHFLPSLHAQLQNCCHLPSFFMHSQLPKGLKCECKLKTVEK